MPLGLHTSLSWQRVLLEGTTDATSREPGMTGPSQVSCTGIYPRQYCGNITSASHSMQQQTQKSFPLCKQHSLLTDERLSHRQPQVGPDPAATMSLTRGSRHLCARAVSASTEDGSLLERAWRCRRFRLSNSTFCRPGRCNVFKLLCICLQAESGVVVDGACADSETHQHDRTDDASGIDLPLLSTAV